MQIAVAILTVIGGVIVLIYSFCKENPRISAEIFVTIGASIAIYFVMWLIGRAISAMDLPLWLTVILAIIDIGGGLLFWLYFVWYKLNWENGSLNIITFGLFKDEGEKELFKKEILQIYRDVPVDDLELLWTDIASPLYTTKKIRPTKAECYNFLYSKRYSEISNLSEEEIERRLGYAYRQIPLSTYLQRLDAIIERNQCAKMFIMKRLGYTTTISLYFNMVYRPGIRGSYPETFQKFMDEHPEYEGKTLGDVADAEVYKKMLKRFERANPEEVLKFLNMSHDEYFKNISATDPAFRSHKELFELRAADMISEKKFQQLCTLSNGELNDIIGYNCDAIPTELLENAPYSLYETRPNSEVYLRKKHAMALLAIETTGFESLWEPKSCRVKNSGYYNAFKAYIQSHPENRILKPRTENPLHFNPDMLRLVEAIQVVYPSVTKEDAEVLWRDVESPVIQLNEKDVCVENCYSFICSKKTELKSSTS